MLAGLRGWITQKGRINHVSLTDAPFGYSLHDYPGRGGWLDHSIRMLEKSASALNRATGKTGKKNGTTGRVNLSLACLAYPRTRYPLVPLFPPVSRVTTSQLSISICPR